MGKLTVEFGAQQRTAFVDSLMALDGYDLGHGYSVAVKVNDYKPNLLRHFWNGHQEGISIDVSVEKDGMSKNVHSVKVWDDGFDTRIPRGAAHYARIMSGPFPHWEGSIVDKDAKRTPKTILDDAAEVAQKLYQKTQPLKPQTLDM